MAQVLQDILRDDHDVIAQPYPTTGVTSVMAMARRRHGVVGDERRRG
jgi:hypothetical protein